MNVFGTMTLFLSGILLSGCSMSAQLNSLLNAVTSDKLAVEVPSLPNNTTHSSDKFIVNRSTLATDIYVKCPSDVSLVTVTAPSFVAGSYDCISNKAKIPFDVAQILDGSHQLAVSAENGQTATLEILKDTVPPTGSLDLSISAYVNKHTQSAFLVTGACSEPNGKVVLRAVADANTAQAVQLESLCSSSNTFSVPMNLTSLSEGALTLSVRHYDSSGNDVEDSVFTIKDITDAAVPTLSFTPSGTTSLSQLVTTISGTDVVSYRYKVGLQSSLNCSSEAGYSAATLIATSIFHDLTSLGYAPLRLCVQSIDIAGNILNPLQALQVDWVRDEGSVQVLLSNFSPAGLVSNQSGVRTVSASGNDITHFKSAVINSGSCADVDFDVIAEVPVVTQIAVNATTSGTYQICAIGKNFADTWQVIPTSSAILTIDLVAPTVNIVATSAAVTATSPVTYSVTFSESVIGFAASDLDVVNGVATISGTGAGYTVSVMPSGSGAVSIKLNAGSIQDAAGNTNPSDSSVVAVTYDAVAPSTSIVTNNSYTTNSSMSPVASWTAATDDHSGVSHYELAVGTSVGGSDVRAWMNVGTFNSGSFNGFSFVQGTSYYFSVRAVDVAGNVGVATSGQAFYYYPNPTVTSINPASGPVAGGTSITIVGTHFIGAMTVSIGGVACTNLVVVSSTSITCDTPAHTSGAKSVNVRNPANQSAVVVDGFTYSAASGKVTFVGVSSGGADQTWVVPTGITSVRVKMWGAGGVSPNANHLLSYGGGGAYVEGDLAVTPGETLTIIAGGHGGYGGGNNAGGGRAAIRRGTTELATAGGGGGGAQGVSANGGAAGDAVSPASDADATAMAGGNGHGKGATPTSGGAAGVTSWGGCTGEGFEYVTATATPGTQFSAGSVGGGGGYYAGGGGMGCGTGSDPIILGGGGGSSYIGGLTNALSLPGNTRFAGNQGDADRAASPLPNAGDSHNPALIIISY